MSTNHKASRGSAIEVLSDGRLMRITSFRVPLSDWERFREIVAEEGTNANADLRAYVGRRVAEAEKAAA